DGVEPLLAGSVRHVGDYRRGILHVLRGSGLLPPGAAGGLEDSLLAPGQGRALGRRHITGHRADAHAASRTAVLLRGACPLLRQVLRPAWPVASEWAVAPRAGRLGHARALRPPSLAPGTRRR